MVLNTIRFLFSSLIENMATILINFLQKFALVRSFQHFVIKFLNQKDFSLAKRVLQDPLLVGEKNVTFFYSNCFPQSLEAT